MNPNDAYKRIAELEDALRPFATFGKGVKSMTGHRSGFVSTGPVWTIHPTSGKVSLTAEHFAAARKALGA